MSSGLVKKAEMPMRFGGLTWAETGRRLGSIASTLPGVWAIVCLAATFVLAGAVYVKPHDFWWHVRAGQWIVENRSVPGADLFSFTRVGEPWIYQSWLMEVVFYSLLRVGGLPLVIFVHAIAITFAYAILLQVNRRAAGGDLRSAAIATVGAVVAGLGNYNIRPQTVSFPLFVVMLYLVERHAEQAWAPSELRQPPALWLLPPLFALWANAHGGFVFGLGLLGSFVLARLIAWVRGQSAFPRDVLLIGALSAGATLLTPVGPGMIDYVLGFVRHPVTRSLNLEFMPPTLRTTPGQLFFGFAIAWVGLLIASGYRPSLRESTRLLLFGVLALTAVRSTVWFSLVAAPTMAACLSCWSDRQSRAAPRRTGRRGINRVIAGVAGILVLLSLPWLRPWAPRPQLRRSYLSPATPVEAVAFLCDLPQPGHVFHTEVYGSYMIWACPDVPVFVDTRIELYPEAQWMDYLALSRARYDWQAILDQYGIDTLLLHRDRQKALIDAATAAPGWQRRYEDDEAVILRRVEGL